MKRYDVTTTLQTRKPNKCATQPKQLMETLCQPTGDKRANESNYYINRNHPVRTLSDAAQHLVRKSITTKLGSKSWQHNLCCNTPNPNRVDYQTSVNKRRLGCALER